MKGKVLRLTTEDETGSAFQDEVTAWNTKTLHTGTDSRLVNYAHPESKTVDVLEQGRGTPKRTYEEYEYDNYGNATVARHYGVVEGDNLSVFDDERITTTSYAYNFTDWLIRFPYEVELTDELGEVIKRSRTFYDDETFAGTNGGSVAIGNVTLTQEWTDIAMNTFIASQRVRYDGFGNPIQLYDPLWQDGVDNGHWREVSYDAHFQVYPETETIHVDGSVATLVFGATYDVGFGTMVSSTTFNGHTTTYGYDALARLVQIVKPSDSETAPTTEYDYLLAQEYGETGIINYVETRARETTGGGQFITREFYDGLGRSRLTKHEDEEADRFVAKQGASFNARREVFEVFNPYQTTHFDFELPVGDKVETHYDALLRTTKVVNQDGTYSNKVYEPLVVRSFDENDVDPVSKHHDTPVVHRQDGLGRLIQADEIVKLDDVGREGPNGLWSTHYSYRADGPLLTVTDSQSNVKTMLYDALGRMTLMDDPDRGLMVTTFDAASNIEQTVDNKGQVIRFTYDGANRLRTEDYLDEGRSFSSDHLFDPGQPVSPSNRADVVYFYDVSAPGSDADNVLGQLAYVWDLTGEEHFSFDERERLACQSKNVRDLVLPNVLVPYRTGYQYDSMDRLVTLGYPDGDVVVNRHNERALLESVLGGPSGQIITNIDYRPWDSLASCSYGNGVMTTYGYDSRLRMTELDTEGSNSHKLIDYSYAFDAVDNIDRITDNRSLSADAGGRKNTQLFRYDSLYRLIGVTYPGIQSASDAFIHYRYDRIGNMLEKTSNLSHERNGVSVSDLGTMAYGGAEGTSGRAGRGTSSAGPHALTSVERGSRSFPYDANGNMSEIDGLICTWDFKDRLVTVENDEIRALYSYDHTDRRILKRVHSKSDVVLPEKETIYVNRYFEIRPDEPPVKYVWHGDTRVARITGVLANDSPVLTQRLRLHRGWNQVSFGAVIDQSQLDDPSSPPVLKAWSWNAAAQTWEAFEEGVLAAHTPVWIEVSEEGFLTVTGPRPPPGVPTTLAPGTKQLVANAGGRPLALNAFPDDTNFWFWDPSKGDWRVSMQRGPLVGILNELPEQLPSQAVVHAESVLGGEVKRAFDRGLDIRYYHQDHLGSSNVVTDAAGALVEEIANYPFGEARHEYQPRGLVERYRFTQKERDLESGLHYFEARFLTAASGRFTRVDPILSGGLLMQEPQRWNPYSYSGNRPLVAVDPSGQVWGLLSKVAKLVIKGGDIAATVAGAVDDAKTVFSKNASLGQRAGAALSLASEILSPVSVRDAKLGMKALDRAGDASSGAKSIDRAGDVAKSAKAPGRAGPPNRIYSKQELVRRADESGPFHNFPESFNDEIFAGLEQL